MKFIGGLQSWTLIVQDVCFGDSYVIRDEVAQNFTNPPWNATSYELLPSLTKKCASRGPHESDSIYAYNCSTELSLPCFASKHEVGMVE